jgi:putative transposase
LSRQDWETGTGTVELRILKLSEGSYFPSFLELRRMAEEALTAATQQACNSVVYLQIGDF